MFQSVGTARIVSRRPLQRWTKASLAPYRLLSVAVPTKGGKLEVAQVQSLFHVWNDALATLDPAKVASLYAKDPYLLPTISNIPRRTVPSIIDYFETFLKLKPQGIVSESYVTSSENYCTDFGLYEFTLGADGSKVRARYSFVYIYEDGAWKIAHHHSSAMPEK